MEKWFIRNKNLNPTELSIKHNISPLLSTLLINRNIITDRDIRAFLYGSRKLLFDPSLLSDMEKATEIILESIKKGEKIRVVGDYDVDGVMSSYILVFALRLLSAKVDYVLPHRIEDGYGINKKIIDEARDDGIKTIITCDNGISALEEVKYAKELDLNIIITDHHDYPKIEDELGNFKICKPEADSVVNPKDPEKIYPFNKICGAFVALKLIENIYRRINSPIDIFYELVEFAAIATICDVVDLVDENRIVTKIGLNKLKNTRNLGLRALIKESGLEDKEIGVYHIGFIIGPSINASGRLESAELALELLFEEDQEKAQKIAKELRILNDERKDITEAGLKMILNKIDENNLDKILLVYEETIHESVAGIIAGRLKDIYNRPTIVLTKSLDGVKGSGRSIEGYNIFEALNNEKDLLIKFGGHPMAAGLSMEFDKIPILRESLNKNTSLKDEDLIPKRYIDFPVKLDQINYQLIKEINKMEPYGKGNPRPLLGSLNVNLIRVLYFGQNKNVVKLLFKTENNAIIEGIVFEKHDIFNEKILYYFKDEKEEIINSLDIDLYLDIIYTPEINEFNNRRSIQLKIESFRKSK